MATFGQYKSIKEQFETVVLDVHDWLSANLMEPLPSRHYSTVADVKEEIQQNIFFDEDMPPHATSNAPKSPYFVLGGGKSLPKFLDPHPPLLEVWSAHFQGKVANETTHNLGVADQKILSDWIFDSFL